MLYKQRYTFNKIDQDLAPDKRDSSTHYNIVNMEAFLTSRGASLQLSKGTTEVPSEAFLTGMYIIGDVTVSKSLYIWITNNKSDPSITSTDAVYEIIITDALITMTLIKQDNWYLSTLNPIQSVGIQESIDVRKLYWVDAFNQARYLRMEVDGLNPLIVNEEVDFIRSNPTPGTIVAQNYGFASASTIEAIVRYSYTLYDSGEGESTLSFATDPVNIGSDLGSAQVTLNIATPAYSNYRIYRTMWTSYNSAPTYTLVKEGELPSTGIVTLIDNGTLFIKTVSIEEIVDLGSDYVIPGSISAKKQHLFFGNYKQEKFTVAEDLRAYAHTSGGVIGLYDEETGATPFATYADVPLDHDAVNPDRAIYQFQADGTTLGVEGEVVVVKFKEVAITELTKLSTRIYKSGETYRVGVVCQDRFGRESYVNWVADIQIPSPKTPAGDGIIYHTLEVALKSQPTDVVTYKIVVVARPIKDRSIIAQGIPQPVMEYTVAGEYEGLYPFPNMKEVKGNGKGTGNVGGWFDTKVPYLDQFDFGGNLTDIAIHNRQYTMIYSPETLLYRTNLPGTGLRAVGCQSITTSATHLGWWNNVGGTGDVQEFNDSFPDIKFDIAAMLDGKIDNPEIGPHFLFGKYDDNTPDAFSIYMYRRSVGKFYPAVNTESSNIEYCNYLGLDATAIIGTGILSNGIDASVFAGDGSNEPCNWEAEMLDCYVTKSPNEGWSSVSGLVAGDNMGIFADSVGFGNSITDRAFPIVDIIQDVPEQYGGNSFDARSTNLYVDASTGSTIFDGVTYLECFGDVYVGLYAFPKTTGARKYANTHYSAVYDYVFAYMESEVAVTTANKALVDLPELLGYDYQNANTAKFIEVKNFLTYDTVYSQDINEVITPTLKFDSRSIQEYPTRIVASSTKTIGEAVDSWTKINLGTYIDLEAVYGAITALVRAKDSIFAFQSKAIAFISIYPDKQTATQSGQIQLGKGSILDDFQYVTVEAGAENFQAIQPFGDDIYFIDTINKNLSSIQGDLSVLKGFNSTVKALMTDASSEYLVNNTKGVFVAFDKSKKEVLFRFSDQFPVLIYNTLTQQFTHSRTYPGYYFIQNNHNMLSGDALSSKLYQHDTGAYGDYYGVHKDAKLQMYVEPVPGVEKVFDALQVMKEGDSNFSKIEVISPTRTSGIVSTNFKSKFDIHTLHLPRVENSRDRFRERNIKINLTYEGVDLLEVDEIFVKFTIKKQ